jgi:hypothetical protein
MPDELDPLTRDQIRTSTARGLRLAGSNKALASAVSIDPADACRLRNGDPAKRSVATLAGELVWRLSKHPRTTGMPLISELIILHSQGIMSGTNTSDLRARLEALENTALDAEMDLTRLLRTRRSDGLAIADARQRVAYIYMELAALGRELEGRS